VPATREIFGEVNNVSRAVRDAGGLNVFLRFTYDGNEKLPWNVWYTNYLSPANLEIMRAGFSRGAPYWQLSPELEVTDHDLIIDKTRFSALIPGTCSMDAELKARGIDTLIISVHADQLLLRKHSARRSSDGIQRDLSHRRQCDAER
jgi:ureidoacrylate peracid hydrolase